jgi:biotin transport system substrate-specific component
MTQSGSSLLMDQWTGQRSSSLDLLEILSFTLLTILSAHVRVTLPFTPVPVTGQTFTVLLAGAVLGARRGFLSQALYLVFGAAGFHFAAGPLTGPTAGYLWMFPPAALLAGWLVERGAARRIWTLALALAAASALVLVGGVCWLGFSLHISIHQALLLGFAPFWLGDVLKIVLVVSLVFSLSSRNPRTMPVMGGELESRKGR